MKFIPKFITNTYLILSYCIRPPIRPNRHVFTIVLKQLCWRMQSFFFFSNTSMSDFYTVCNSLHLTNVERYIRLIFNQNRFTECSCRTKVNTHSGELLIFSTAYKDVGYLKLCDWSNLNEKESVLTLTLIIKRNLQNKTKNGNLMFDVFKFDTLYICVRACPRYSDVTRGSVFVQLFILCSL